MDVAPYFLVGGGARRLASYRSRSFLGRLARVLTKTILSVAAARDPTDPTSTIVGVGVRSTFHDPHDVVGLSLPEAVAAELAQAGVPTLEDEQEDVHTAGVDLTALFANARRQIRRPTANPQVSGGWGVAERLRGGILTSDSTQDVRHSLWLGAQFTLGRRFDLLTTIEMRNAFRADRYWWLGVGLERRTADVNYLTEVYYDTDRGTWHPGVAADARVSSHLGVVASITRQSATLSGHGPDRLELRTLARWFYASDR